MGDPDARRLRRWGSAKRADRRRSEAPGFSREPGGICATFELREAGVLRRLASDLESLLEEARQDAAGGAKARSEDPFEALLDDMRDGPTEAPLDPVVARLLPDAYPDDAEAAGDFRRFTDSEIRGAKTANARAIRDVLPAHGGEVCLDDEQAEVWLAGLNDMRLSLGTALEVNADSYEEYQRMDPLSPRARRLFLYHWLGLLQETLLEAMLEPKR